jgi:hypothetical protein
MHDGESMTFRDAVLRRRGETAHEVSDLKN